MPPKARFTKEEVTEAAFEILRERGLSSLTARSLGAALGCSARPIFTVFRSMEEVQQEAIRAARDLYNQYIQTGLSSHRPYERPFKSVGAQYIRFAIKEPKLFQLLFMREQISRPDFGNILPMIDENYEMILGSIQEDYGMNAEAARRLYQHLWIYTHGIASLCATGMCCFTEEEIGRMMTEVFMSILEREKRIRA